MKSRNPWVYRRFFAFFGFFVLELFSLSSCTVPQAGPSPSVPTHEEQYIYHRIKYSGETVAVISAWYTKSSQNWPEIVEANPKMVPSKLQLGDLVRIPKNLVRRSGSLPPEFVTSFKSGVNKDSSRSGIAVAPEIPSVSNGKELAESENSLKNRPIDSIVKEDRSKQTATGTVKKEQVVADSNSSIEPKIAVESKLREEKLPISVPNSDAGAANVAVAEENQKIRDQLMQELLQ